MTTKNVTITVKRRSDHDITHGQDVLKALRAAGVPVQGVLWPTGVDGGLVTIVGDEWTCTWGELEEELF